ncbi:MAG: DinB family protein [Planctomycetota bacterium]
MDKPIPSVEDVPLILDTLLGQFQWARRYTLQLLDATPRDRWYEIPPGHVSHVAWQVGHLAVSHYGLWMFRIRGRQPDDLKLIPGRFRKRYGRGGTPPASEEDQMTPDELMDKLHEVSQQSLAEVMATDPEVWLEPVEMPYAVYPCKLGAICFSPLHEQLHAGQIGGIRRGLGLEILR